MHVGGQQVGSSQYKKLWNGSRVLLNRNPWNIVIKSQNFTKADPGMNNREV
jgi:hypothetical protein